MSLKRAIKFTGVFLAGSTTTYLLTRTENESNHYYREAPENIKKKLEYELGDWTAHFKAKKKWDYNWDRRAENLVRKGKSNEKLKKPKASRNLILIRHGQYNTDALVDEERILTKLGQEQADMTGKRLQEFPINYDKLKHMPDTLSCESSDLLREGAPIPPEPPTSNMRLDSNFFEDGARIEAAFRRFVHRADPHQEKTSYEVLVCHANVIRYFVCRALQLPPEAWLRMSLRHGSITWLTIRHDGIVTLRMLGDAGHMPPDIITSR